MCFPRVNTLLGAEFFLPTLDDIKANVVSFLLNISQQSTNLSLKFSRSIVHLNKYSSTPPKQIFISMTCQGVTNSQGVGHLIAYGIKGKQSDVSSDVYDGGPYTYENNKKQRYLTSSDLSMAL